MRPRNGAPSYFFGGSFSHVFLGGRIGVLFAPFSFCPAQNGVELGPRAPFWSHSGSHFGPQRLKFGAMCFRYLLLSLLSVSQKSSMLDPFVSVRFIKNILHIAPTPTPKTSKHISSLRLSQKLPDHSGAAVSRSVLRYIYIYIYI